MTTCVNCSIKPVHRKKTGRCRRCERYFVMTGKDCPYREDGRRERYSLLYDRQCRKCSATLNKGDHPVAGYCRSCYPEVWRARHKHIEIYGNGTNQLTLFD